jgi:hypothetical protein
VVQSSALLDMYAITQDMCMPIDEIIDIYMPDNSTAFKAYLVSEMSSIKDEQQQQQQGYAANHMLNTAAPAAGPPASNGSSNPSSSGRGLLTAAGSVGASNAMRPAAALLQTFGSAVRAHPAHGDGIMAQLSEVFIRLSTQMLASSQDSKEMVCSRLEHEVMNISDATLAVLLQQCVPAGVLMGFWHA